MTQVAGFVEKFSHRLKGALRQFFGAGFEHCRHPVECEGLRAACMEEFPTDPATLAAWDRLADRSPIATTFHRPVWQAAVFEKLCNPERLRLIAVWQNQNLVGVLPMSMRDDSLLETLGPSVTDYLDPLIEPDFEPAVWRAILRVFSQLRNQHHSRVTLHNVRDSDASRKLLPSLAKEEGFEFEERASEYTPVLALPKTWDDYLAAFDAHERKETRRKINKAMTKGAGRLVRCSADPTEIASTLQWALALMEQAPGQKGEDIRRTLRPILEMAAPPLIAAGHLILTTLMIEDQPAAVILQLPYPSGPELYNCGFDNSKREWSPGVVLTALSIQQAIESGAQQYDLLRGQEPYKYKLGATDRPLWMLNLRKI